MNFLSNMLKAAASVALAPVALVVDVLTLPASSFDPHRGPFERTGALLSNAGDKATEAVK